MPRWDNTARRLERATSWAHATPERYGEWLRAAVEETQQEHPNGRQMIFINAWNEWAEGAHLEPDTRHGYRYLEETLAALRTAQGGTHGLPLESTSGRHPDVIHERHARLEKCFGGELPVAVRDLLSGHVALVAQLASAGATLAVDHETATCEIGGETLVLDGPATLARGHERRRALLRDVAPGEHDERLAFADRAAAGVISDFQPPFVMAGLVPAIHALL